MKIETLLFGCLPAILALGCVAFSVRVALRRRTVAQGIAAVLVLLLCTFAVVILYAMFVKNAWPTFVPHLAILIAMLLCTAQVIFAKRASIPR